MSDTPPPREALRPPLGATQAFVRKGLARFDFHDPYYFAISLNWPQFGLLFLSAELSLNIVFAGLYLAEPGAIANEPFPGFLSAFFFSLETLATVGYGEMYPGTTYGHAISALEILVGTAFTAIMTGLLFVRFSKPTAKILYADNPVVAMHDGKKTLMLRIANGRRSVLNSTEIGLHMLVRTVSSEGIAHAYIRELPLLRGTIPVLAITFTMMHVIDEASPFHGWDADHAEVADLRLFVSVRGHDPAIGQVVADSRSFSGADIRFGMRYVDAVSRDEAGRVIADYSRLGTIVADMPRGDVTAGGPT